MVSSDNDVARSLDREIDRLVQKIKMRVDSLRDEIDAREKELRGLEAQLGRLTGNSASARRGDVGRTARGSKRIRRLGVDVPWIESHLRIRPQTLKQLQSTALSEGRSALSVMNVLRLNQAKFKSSEGTKDSHQRGRAAHVWSAK
jgi:hypothetical protein